MSNELVSRQSAIDQKLSKYFTGEPCKRDHVSERYTINSGCVECVHPSFGEETKSTQSDEGLLAKLEITKQRLALRQEELRIKLFNAESRRKDQEFAKENDKRLGKTRSTAQTVRHAITQMQTINIRVDEDNLLFFKGEVLKLAQSKCEDLSLYDLISTGRPRAGNIHVFRCFPEHAGQLRELQNSLEKPLPRKTDDHSMIGTYAPFNVGDPVMAMIDGRGRPAWILAIEEDSFVLITPSEDIATVGPKEMIGHWHIKEPLPAIVAQLRNLTS